MFRFPLACVLPGIPPPEPRPYEPQTRPGNATPFKNGLLNVSETKDNKLYSFNTSTSFNPLFNGYLAFLN